MKYFLILKDFEMVEKEQRDEGGDCGSGKAREEEV